MEARPVAVQSACAVCNGMTIVLLHCKEAVCKGFAPFIDLRLIPLYKEPGAIHLVKTYDRIGSAVFAGPSCCIRPPSHKLTCNYK